jgi:hypothetical protein
VAIIGGGIAGLWLLNCLKQEGFSTVLFEKSAMGGVQSINSQGIIHSGVKYSFTGKLHPAAQAMSQLPQLWKDCLQGKGAIPLSGVETLSESTFLWPDSSVGSRFFGFMASKLMRSQVEKLSAKEYPDFFQKTNPQGPVYWVQEPVVDLVSLMEVLVKNCQDYIFSLDFASLNDGFIALPSGEQVEFKAKKTVLAAGKGNAELMEKMGVTGIEMQTRPLHAVAIKHQYEFPVFAHCITTGAVPRITITSPEKNTWYLGGQIAETGVGRSKEEQIRFAKKELKSLFPGLDFSRAKYESFLISRAENWSRNNQRPDSHFFKSHGDVIVAWPTKLALAPILANEIVADLNKSIEKSATDLSLLQSLPKPPIAIPLWKKL